MAVIETWLEQDLQAPVKVRYLDGSLFSNNGNGNRIGVRVYNNGEPVTLSGTVSGYVVVADGSTVPCTGSRSGNQASILIPPAAYQPGAVFISVFLTDGSTVTTLAAVSTTVMQTRTNSQVSPGSVVTDWTQTINAAMQSVVDANAANMAQTYGELTFPVPMGKYTLYNDLLYRAVTPIATSESWTAAHWTRVKLADDVSDLKLALDYTGNLFWFMQSWEIHGIYTGNGNNNNDVNYAFRTSSTQSKRLVVGSNESYTIKIEDKNIISLINAYKYDLSDHTYKGYIQTDDSTELQGGYEYRFAFYLKDHSVVVTTAMIDTYRQYVGLYKYLSAEFIETKKTLASRYAGKKISIIGDSIDTFDKAGYKIDGYNMYYPSLGVNTVDQTWWKQVINNSGAELEVNASWSGSRVTDTHTDPSFPDFYDRVSVIGSPDIIFVTLGTNDSSNSVALGEYDFTTAYASLSESQFRPAYIKGVKALQASYPSAKIVCIAQKMSAEYKESIAHIARVLGAQFVDASDYTGQSGVHPGIIGMKQIASLVLFPTDTGLWEKHFPADAEKMGLVADSVINVCDPLQMMVWNVGSIYANNGTNYNDVKYAIRTDNAVQNRLYVESGKTLALCINDKTTVNAVYAYQYAHGDDNHYIKRIGDGSQDIIFIEGGYDYRFVVIMADNTLVITESTIFEYRTKASVIGYIVSGIIETIEKNETILKSLKWEVGSIYASNGNNYNDPKYVMRTNGDNANRLFVEDDILFINSNEAIARVFAFQYNHSTHAYIKRLESKVGKGILLPAGYEYRLVQVLVDDTIVLTTSTIPTYLPNTFIFGKESAVPFDVLATEVARIESRTGVVYGSDLMAKPITEKLIASAVMQGSQAFTMYDGYYFSTDGTKVYKQDASFEAVSNAEISTGHGNSFQIGSGNIAYISGWDDDTVYCVDLDSLTLDGTIALPTEGYTTAAIDDLNKIAYIFQRDTNPSTVEHYNFIVYDYQNQQVLKRRVINAFSAMQDVDFYDGLIVVAYGLGTAQNPNGITVYNTNGDVVARFNLGMVTSTELEGIHFDRANNKLLVTGINRSIFSIEANVI